MTCQHRWMGKGKKRAKVRRGGAGGAVGACGVWVSRCSLVMYVGPPGFFAGEGAEAAGSPTGGRGRGTKKQQQQFTICQGDDLAARRRGTLWECSCSFWRCGMEEGQTARVSFATCLQLSGQQSCWYRETMLRRRTGPDPDPGPSFARRKEPGPQQRTTWVTVKDSMYE